MLGYRGTALGCTLPSPSVKSCKPNILVAAVKIPFSTMASKKLVDYFKDEEMRVEDLDLDPKDTFPIICLSDSDQKNETKSESRVTSSCSTELIEKKRQLFHKGKIVKYLMVNDKKTPIRVSPIKAKDCVRPTSLRHFINNKRFMSHWLNS